MGNHISSPILCFQKAVDWSAILRQLEGESSKKYIERSVDAYRKLVDKAAGKVRAAWNRDAEAERQIRRLVPPMSRDRILNAQLACLFNLVDDASESSAYIAAVLDTYIRNHVVNGLANSVCYCPPGMH